MDNDCRLLFELYPVYCKSAEFLVCIHIRDFLHDQTGRQLGDYRYAFQWYEFQQTAQALYAFSRIDFAGKLYLGLIYHSSVQRASHRL